MPEASGGRSSGTLGTAKMSCEMLTSIGPKAMSNKAKSPWDDYRRRSFWLMAIFISFLPGSALMIFPLTYFFHSDAPFYVIAPCWMLAWIFVVLRYTSFPCPSCSKPFFHRWVIGNPCATSCMNCGFPKWKEPDNKNA